MPILEGRERRGGGGNQTERNWNETKDGRMYMTSPVHLAVQLESIHHLYVCVFFFLNNWRVDITWWPPTRGRRARSCAWSDDASRGSSRRTRGSAASPAASGAPGRSRACAAIAYGTPGQRSSGNSGCTWRTHSAMEYRWQRRPSSEAPWRAPEAS